MPAREAAADVGQRVVHQRVFMTASRTGRRASVARRRRSGWTASSAAGLVRSLDPQGAGRAPGLDEGEGGEVVELPALGVGVEQSPIRSGR